MKNLIFFLCLLSSFATWAQGNWDLEKCINYAVEHSIDINQADLFVADAEVVKKMNEKERMPSLTGNASTFTNFGRTIDPTTNDFVTSAFLSNNFSLNAGIMLYNGGRIKNNIKVAELDKQAVLADKNSMVASITLQVVQAYFEALLATDNYSNAEIQLKSINDQIDQMRKLVNAGSRAQFEIFDLEAQQASSEQDLTLAQNRIDLAMLSLKGIMNIEPMTEMTLDSPPIDQLAHTDIENDTFEEIYNRVVASRPEFEALDIRIQSGEIGIEVAKAGGLPTISIGGNLSTRYSNQAKGFEGVNFVRETSPAFINGEAVEFGEDVAQPARIFDVPYLDQLSDNFSYGVGLQVSVPILDNYQAKGNKERARINFESLKTDKEKFIIDIRNLLGQYITDARAAKRNLQASEKVLRARDIAFQNAEKRFNLGAINSFDYISIQDQLNTARTDQIIAKYDYMMKIKILDFYQGYPVSIN